MLLEFCVLLGCCLSNEEDIRLRFLSIPKPLPKSDIKSLLPNDDSLPKKSSLAFLKKSSPKPELPKSELNPEKGSMLSPSFMIVISVC